MAEAAPAARLQPGSPEETPDDRARWIAAIKAGVAKRRAAVLAAQAAGAPPPPPKRERAPRLPKGRPPPRIPDPEDDDRAPVTERDRLELRREIERGTEPRRIAAEFGVPIAVVNAIRFAMEAA